MRTIVAALMFVAALAACAPAQTRPPVQYTVTRAEAIGAIVQIGANMRPTPDYSTFVPVSSSETGVTIRSTSGSSEIVMEWSVNERSPGRSDIGVRTTLRNLNTFDSGALETAFYAEIDQRFQRVPAPAAQAEPVTPGY